MAKVKPEARAGEQELVQALFAMKNDPYAFVMYVFPWGEEGTPLAKYKQPRRWQLDILKDLRDHLQAGGSVEDYVPDVFKMAVSSGRGIGKTAIISWLALWMLSCIPGSSTIVSANTETQLRSKTFPEIRKWARMAINSNWFDPQATSIRPAEWLVEALHKTTKIDAAYWYISAQLWSEENPDAFAGMHSQYGMMVLFDEASGIPAPIWPVTEGFFTDRIPHRVWFVISNPRNPSGPFYECFHGNRSFWRTRMIDARSVDENDPAVYQKIIDQYGSDSDQARVEVYGQFPRQGDSQFIDRGLVLDAQARELVPDGTAPLVMAVDPARFGDDNAVIRFRQGRDARSIPPTRIPRCSAVELATAIAEHIDRYNPDAVFVEGDGVGGGVIDIVRSYGYRVIEVKAGGGASDKTRYANHRAEIWGRMNDWLEGGCLNPTDTALADDLCTPQFDYTQQGQMKLEAKASIRKRGYRSPNDADALALTFSRTIARRNAAAARHRRPRIAAGVDYDIFGRSLFRGVALLMRRWYGLLRQPLRRQALMRERCVT